MSNKNLNEIDRSLEQKKANRIYNQIKCGRSNLKEMTVVDDEKQQMTKYHQKISETERKTNAFFCVCISTFECQS